MYIQNTASRSARRLQKSVQKARFISFKVASEYYAFPLECIERVVDDYSAHATTEDGHGLIRFQGQTLTLVDLRFLFSTQQPPVPLTHLIICQNKHREKIGIPVEEIPQVITVMPEQIQPIPNLYDRTKLPKAVSALICTDDSREYFYLEIEEVIVPASTAESYDSIESLLLANLNSSL